MRRTRMLVAPALALACVAGAGRAGAAVADSTAAGYTVRHESVVAAAPDSVWRALLRVERWWSPEHTYSGDGRNLSLDPTPGGCFCERLPGGGIQHMTVAYASAPKDLRLLGALGPLQAGAVTGSLTWTLAPDPAGTKLRMEYVFGGYMPGGLGGVLRAVDRVLVEQAVRLQHFVERGRADE